VLVQSVSVAPVPAYLFQASDSRGAVTNGKIEARSLVEAREALKGRGLFNIQFLQSYIYQATNPTGRPITSEVEAENLDEAEKILVTAGYTKIKFFDSENIGAIREMTIAGSSDGESARRRPTPRQMMGSMARRTLRHKVLWAIGRHLVYLGPLLLWNVVALLHQPPHASRHVWFRVHRDLHPLDDPEDRADGQLPPDP
jgi:hypothetical protein